ncbi:TPA: (2,3-dihydroxybenzoyl)adenylate synthase [Vibrio vulnificus]|uniref:(2,3-dihydroxybenzoyl)adenylate synthase n=1 Tax=Vibrio vulnificus TaxID=672 RepID=UPI001A194EB7|nr:AMP-binding protein [Vibrio vulnificus]EJU9788060.1 AMP-binding protein [Vibrio vulnificus]MCA3989141.1 AMP-binding protein [Vibrio vulnificus]MCJ0803060.1 AMP-binding protein [Vibrio vulnificus]HAS8251383.1 (2,3-dihydroxybenzoyl)adenylate synthase [Vibrio vulnificus]HAS8348083.1 (2,3-dihydroxybenzoyl)adenylate synthase [Vibrio vulnificus]
MVVTTTETPKQILDGFVRKPSVQSEQYQAANLWRNSPLWQILHQGVEHHPDSIAVTDNHTSLSYLELASRVDRIAAGLREEGLVCGDSVVLQLANTLDFLVVFFALQRLGVVPVLALPAHGLVEIRHFMQLSEAKVYIGSNHEKDDKALAIATQLQAELSVSIRCYISGHCGQFSPLPECGAGDFTPAMVDPEHPALFLVSGGTTGLPKLIPRTHNDYLFNVEQCAKASEISAQDVYLAVLPVAHNFTLGCPGILGVLNAGGKVVLTTNPSPDHCFELIEKQRITATALVPALAQLWTEATQWESTDRSSLRLMQVGGSKLAYSDALEMQNAFPNALQQVFGMAEGLIACTRLGDDKEIIATRQGRPVSEWDEVLVVDDQGKPVAVGEEGELLTRGPYTLSGYYRAPEHNLRAFTDEGYYRSGDRVVVDANGYFTVTGRIKDVIIRAGENIAADELEELLLSHPQIAQVAVFPLPDAHLGEKIAVAAVIRGPEIMLRDIRQFLQTKEIAAFKLPDELFAVKSLPKTAVGKIDKKRILSTILP